MNFGKITLNQSINRVVTGCYMDTESFIIHIKTEDFYEDIDNDVENWFDTSNYDDNRPLPIGIKKEYKEEFKDELGAKIVKEFVTARYW